MLRTVITQADAGHDGNGLGEKADDYKTRLLKYIPSETVALYTGLIGIPISLQAESPGWYWAGLIIVFLAGLVGTPLLLMRGYGITWRYKKKQIVVSTVAYVLWVAALGTFQDAIPVPAAIVTIVLGIFTLGAPLIDPGTNTSTGSSEGVADAPGTSDAAPAT
jgi:hypothetical protein